MDPLAIARIAARESTLGEGMRIRRALPTRERRMVGAWCFLDHIGPIAFGPDQGLHVGAHPHTCLQTFTWMIEGEIWHRDSLGSDQVIRPGQVNLMTAGRGIVHTEDSVVPGQRMHAAQLWIALPPEVAEGEPAFEHHAELPRWTQDGCDVTLLVGHWGGHTAPTRVHSPLVGLDIACPPASGLNAPMDLPIDLPLRPDFEHGLLPLEGEVHIDGAEGPQRFVAGEFAHLAPGARQARLLLSPGSRVLLIGGEPWPHPMVMWWNFVGPSQAHIVRAQADWEAGAPRFDRVPGDGGHRLQAPPLPWKA